MMLQFNWYPFVYRYTRCVVLYDSTIPWRVMGIEMDVTLQNYNSPDPAILYLFALMTTYFFT